jgi:2-methylcitrate dehydratase PrpD
MTLAERLAAFAADLRFEDIPPAVVASVRLRALDILGIAVLALGDVRILMPLCRAA